MRQITLGELIEYLADLDQSAVLPRGFYNPHSYRGYYDQLAFEPVNQITVGEMLGAARSALNRRFIGYKGGEFWMSEPTPAWIAFYGATEGSHEITKDFLDDLCQKFCKEESVVLP